MIKLNSKSFGKKRMAIVAGSFILLAAVVGILFYQGTKQTVSLTLNGQKQTIRTHAETIHDILKDFEITVKAEDYLSPSKESKVKDGVKVVWEEAKPIQLQIDGEMHNISTTLKTVEGVLQEQDIKLTIYDNLNPSADTAIQKDMQINIKKAFALTLSVGGSEKQVWSTSTTVADFLLQQGVSLNDLDRVEPGLDQKILANNTVNVIRVEKVTDVVEEPVEFSVITKKDKTIIKGSEKVINEGKPGLVSKAYEVIKENGKEVKRTLISEKVVAQKADKVISIGTKEVVAATQVSWSESTSSEEGGEEFYVYSTAYTASCNGCSGKTATGLNLKQNPNAKVIAVDPRVIPLGTKVFVDGYGYATAADKGGAIKGNKIDVFFASKSDAYRWGVKKVKIRIIE